MYVCMYVCMYLCVYYKILLVSNLLNCLILLGITYVRSFKDKTIQVSIIQKDIITKSTIGIT